MTMSILNVTDAGSRLLSEQARRGRTAFSNIASRERIILLACAILSLLVRLVALRFAEPITGDGIWYATLGKNLVAGHFRAGLSTYWPPLYPALVGISSLLFGDIELAGRAVSILAGCLLIIPVYLLARDAYGKDTAAVAAFFITILPVFIYFSTVLLTEATYTLLLMTGIYTGWRALAERNSKMSLFTGIVFGATYLIRPEAIGYLGLLVALTLSTKLINRQLPTTKIVLNALTLLVAFTLVALPYLIYLRHHTGRWTISEKTVAASTAFPGWRKLTDAGSMTYADKLWAGQANSEPGMNRVSGIMSATAERHNISTLRVGFLKELIARLHGVMFMFEVLRKMLQPLLILLVGLGLFATSWTRRRLGMEIYLSLFFVATLVGYGFIQMPEERYLVPVMPMIACWSAKGVLELERWLAESIETLFGPGNLSEKKRMVLKPLIVTSVVVLLMPAIASLFMSKPWNPKPIAMWIKEHSKRSPLIMASQPWPAFYAEGKHLYIPDEDYPTVIEYARRKHVDLIVVAEDQIGVTPKMGFLLNEQSQPPGLVLVYKNDAEPKHKVLVWSLTDVRGSDTTSL